MVRVNVPTPVPMAFHSLGGRKHSLFDEMAVPGMESVRFYTLFKTVTARWPTGIRAGAKICHPDDAVTVLAPRRPEATCR